MGNTKLKLDQVVFYKESGESTRSSTVEAKSYSPLQFPVLL